MATKKKRSRKKTEKKAEVSVQTDMAIAEPVQGKVQLDVNVKEPVEINEAAIGPKPGTPTSSDLQTAADAIQSRLTGDAKVVVDPPANVLAIHDGPETIKESFALANRLAVGLRKEGKIKALPTIVKVTIR